MTASSDFSSSTLTDLQALQAENAQLQERVVAVLADHWQTSQMWGGERRLACGRCAYMDGVRFLWPCPTRRALTGESEPNPAALAAAPVDGAE